MNTPSSFGEMLVRVQFALGLSQRELARLLGCSERTVRRYYDGGTLLPETYAKLAQACHPKDPALAAHLAERAGVTLEGLGIGVAPPAPVVVAPPVVAPVFAPAAPHLADSIVCAAAEALDASPGTIRPALVAALERMKALGMSAAEALEALRPAAPAKRTKPAEPSRKKAADKG